MVIFQTEIIGVLTSLPQPSSAPRQQESTDQSHTDYGAGSDQLANGNAYNIKYLLLSPAHTF